MLLLSPFYAQFNNWHFQFDSFNEFFSALFVLSHFFPEWMLIPHHHLPKIQVLKVANYSKGSSMMILYWQRKHVPYLYGKYVKVLIIFIQNQSYILIWKYVFLILFLIKFETLTSWMNKDFNDWDGQVHGDFNSNFWNFFYVN